MPTTIFSGANVNVNWNEQEVSNIVQNYVGPTSHTHTVSQITDLLENGKIKNSLIPSIAITDVFVVADNTERDLLSVQTGDVAKVTETNVSYIYDGTQWVELSSQETILTLNELLNVEISSLVNNQGLRYNSTTGKWVNYYIINNLASLLDVQFLVNPSANQIIQDNGTHWVNTTLNTSLSGLTDAQITTQTTNQLLQDNGTKWINATVSTGGSTTLAGLTDVNLTGLANGNILKYSTSNSKWNISDLAAYVYAVNNLSVNNILFTSSVGSGGSTINLKGITSPNNYITVSNDSNNVNIQLNPNNLTTDLIPQGSTNLYFTNAYKNSVDRLNDLSNSVHTLSTFSLSDGFIVPPYTDESIRPVVMTYTPNAITGQLSSIANLTFYPQLNAQFGAGDPISLILDNNPSSTYIQWNVLTPYWRININLNSAYAITKFFYAMANDGLYMSVIKIYASANSAMYFENSLTPPNGTLIHTINSAIAIRSVIEVPIPVTAEYQYWSIIFDTMVGNGYGGISSLDLGLVNSGTGGTYTSIYEPSNFSISTDNTTGYPGLTRINGSGASIVSLSNLLIFEAYHRLYPVIRGTNDVRIGSLTINDTGLVTSSNTIYDVLTIGPGGYDLGGAVRDGNIQGAPLKFGNNHSASNIIQLRNYKGGVISVFFMTQTSGTQGYVRWKLDYTYINFIGTAVTGTVFAEDIVPAALSQTYVLVDIPAPMFVANNNGFSTLQFTITRVTATLGTAPGGNVFLMCTQFKFPIRSFGTTV